MARADETLFGPSASVGVPSRESKATCNTTLLLDPRSVPPLLQRTVRLTPEELAAFAAANPPPVAEHVEIAPEAVIRTPAPTPTSPPAAIPIPMAAALTAPPVAIPGDDAPRMEERRTRPRLGLVLVMALPVVLGLIAFATLEFLISTNKTWIAPTVLTSTDARVLQVSATIQQETARQSELLLSRKELATRLREAERWVAVEATFQTGFRAALESDLQVQRAELRRLRSLLEVDAEEGSRDEDTTAKLAAVRERIRVLEAASKNPRGAGAYDALALRREFDRSVVASEKARELATALTKALADTDEVLRQKAALVASLRGSPYSLAADGDVALAFVPYENRRGVEAGTPVYACKTSLFRCRKVGSLGAALPGEIQGTHPLDGRALRGQLFRLTLSEPQSAERPVLYAGRAPL